MSDMKPVEEYKILDEPSLEKIRTLSVYYSKRSQLSKAKEELHWVAERDLNKMCEDSWRWQSMNPNGYED